MPKYPFNCTQRRCNLSAKCSVYDNPSSSLDQYVPLLGGHLSLEKEVSELVDSLCLDAININSFFC